MKPFPFAIWPSTLMKAVGDSTPERLGSARSYPERLDPARSYSVRDATPIVDPETDPMEPVPQAGQLRDAFHYPDYVHTEDPFKSIYFNGYGFDGESGYLPAGYAHRNADIRGRQHFLASAHHDAAFHELSDLHRAIGPLRDTGEISPEHLTLLHKAEQRFLRAKALLEFSRTAHARALAEPAMTLEDTYHGIQGQTAQEQLKKLLALRGGVTFPATSFANFGGDTGLPSDKIPQEPETRVARKMALLGSAPFLPAYLNFSGTMLPSGFLPEGDLTTPDYRYPMPKTPEEIVATYKMLAESRNIDAKRGLPPPRPMTRTRAPDPYKIMSEHPSHVADGTDTWADFSGDARYARAFRPHTTSEWARLGHGATSVDRAATLLSMLDAFYRG